MRLFTRDVFPIVEAGSTHKIFRMTCEYDCGPACIVNVSERPDDIDYDALMQACRTTKRTGTSSDGMRAGLDFAGVVYREMRPMTTRAIVDAVEAGARVITSIGVAGGEGHWVVVVARTPQGLRLIDPETGERDVAIDRFDADRAKREAAGEFSNYVIP